MMGTPNEQIWPGVSTLPDFGLRFPCWKSQPFPSAIVRYPDRDLQDLFKVNKNIHCFISFAIYYSYLLFV